MKLAEALSLRSDLQTRIEQLTERLDQVVLVQEGDEPGERPADLLNEVNECIAQLEHMVVCINKTNMQCTLPCGATLTEKIARRDILTRKVKVLQSILQTASARTNRYSHSEIKFVATVDVTAIRKMADECSKQIRLVDNEIQAANWNFDLCE